MNIRLLITAIVQLISLFIVAVVALVAYAAHAEQHAEKKANAFCATVKVGDPTQDLQQRAIAAGADQRRTRWVTHADGTVWMPVTFNGFTPISRHICFLEAQREKLTDVHYVYLD